MSRGELLEIRVTRRGAGITLSAALVGAVDSIPSDATAFLSAGDGSVVVDSGSKTSGHLFLASRTGDALLVKYDAIAREESVRVLAKEEETADGRRRGHNKQRRRGGRGSVAPDGAVLDAEDAEIYGTQTRDKEDAEEEEEEEMRYEVVQRFANPGPVLDMDFTDSLPLSAGGAFNYN